MERIISNNLFFVLFWSQFTCYARELEEKGTCSGHYQPMSNAIAKAPTTHHIGIRQLTGAITLRPAISAKYLSHHKLDLENMY